MVMLQPTMMMVVMIMVVMVMRAARPAFMVVVVVMMIVVIRRQEGWLDLENALEIKGPRLSTASSGTAHFCVLCSTA